MYNPDPTVKTEKKVHIIVNVQWYNACGSIVWLNHLQSELWVKSQRDTPQSCIIISSPLKYMYPVFPTRIIVLHAHPQVIYCNRQTDGTMDRVIPIYPPQQLYLQVYNKIWWFINVQKYKGLSNAVTVAVSKMIMWPFISVVTLLNDPIDDSTLW